MTNYDRPSLRSVKASGPAVGLSAPLIIPIPSSCNEAALWPGRYLNHEGENLEAEGGTKRKKNRFAAEKKISHVSFDNLTLIYPPFFTPVRNHRGGGVKLPPRGISVSRARTKEITTATPMYWR